MNILTTLRLLSGFSLWAAVAGAAPAPVLTVQVGAPAQPPTPLVNHGDTWHYHKGTNAPGAGWQTQADASLDPLLWSTGNGGFGYSTDTPNEVSLCQTILGDMINFYTTLYVRRSFEITDAVDPTRHLMLTMDWDDGFVAYLDGAELIRRNAGAGPDEPANTATASPNHESSRGTSGNPPMTFDLNAVGSRLSPGIHTLAIIALNGTPGSSDLVLLADLSLSGGGASVAGGGPLFAIVNGTTTPLSGTNTIPGSTRVTVNGEEAAFSPATGEWSLNKTLTPGLNNLFVAALDSTGAIRASTNRDVLAELSTTSVGGPVTGYSGWTGAGQVFRVTNTVTVGSGAVLVISNGPSVLFSPGASIRAVSGGQIIVHGLTGSVVFGPADGATAWGELSANGTGALLWIRQAEIIAGQVIATADATVWIYESVLRDFRSGNRLFLAATNAAQFTLSQCHLLRYDQARFSGTPVRIEDCLIERVGSDATDFADSANIVVRNTTYRYGTGANTDAIDLGQNPGTLIEGVIIHDFPDKGVSIAGGSHGTVVRNSLIFGNGFGLSAYASSNCVFTQSTIADCTSGIALWERNAGDGSGHASGTNLIVWGNTTNVHLANGGTLDASYSDIGGALWPGTGNINSDPLFVDAAHDDYHLATGSPARGTGLEGQHMGVRFLENGSPAGGMSAAPFDLAAIVSGTNAIQLVWREDSLNEFGFILARSTDGTSWLTLATPELNSGGLVANVTNYTDTTAALNQRYFYRVTAVGNPRPSNVAGAIRQEPNLFVGGTLPANTTWSPALGTVTVMANLIVPSGITLTVLPGTMVKVTNNASIIAAGGGIINISGTADNKVRLMPLNGTDLWGQLSAQFTGSSLTVRHADISYAQVTVYSNAVGLLEDSFIHDYRRPGASILIAPIILTHFAAPTTVRRCHVREYHETLWRNGVLTIEECLFENIYGDAVDFDAAQTGTVIRNCTFRHGTLGNVDAVDVGPGDMPGAFNVRIENCMMFNFPFDKGVSVGDNNSSRGTIVSNCFIYSCLSGVQAKDLCDVSVRNCTIVNNNWGFTNYNKVNPTSPTGGGILTNCYNNILWGNGITISMVNDSRLYADHNDFSNTNWPGEGNFDFDPLFVNPAGRDYRLTANSPCIETGRDGADMGARFPVGAAMVLSHPRIEQIDASGGNAVVRFWADNEKTYSLLCSPVVEGGTWTKLADVPLGTVPRYLSVTNALAPNNRFYRLVTPAEP